MSRWGLTNPPRDPFLYALDPETEGEAPTPEELDDLVQAVARTHVEQTALGLGLLKSTGDEIAVAPRRLVRVAEDDQERLFAGAIVTPFGPLDLDFDRAKQLSELLPDPDLMQFVGLDEDLLDAYLQGEALAPRERQRIGNRSLLGRDGLVVAPVQQMIDVS